MKFDENSRRRVIRELQRNYRVQLSRIGRTWKYLKDNNGARYIVLGGIDYRYEIPRAIVDEEERAPGDCILVVATLDGNNLDVFVGPFRPMLEHKHQLSMNNDHYAFHLHRFTSRLVVREIPSLELKQINQQTPEERARAIREMPEKRRRVQALAVAKARRLSAAGESRTRSDRGVVAVEGNLIRADFRRGKSR